DQRGFNRFISGGLRGVVDIGAYEAFYSQTPVTVGGRLTTSTGRGVGGGRVTAAVIGGITHYALTNSSAYYRFAGLLPGSTYTVTVSHKYYQFTTPLFVTVDQNRNDLNFAAF